MAVSVVLLPVMKMTGLRASISRSSVSVSRPERSGRWMSRTITSGWRGAGQVERLGGAFGGNQVDVGGAKGALKGVADGGFVID